MATENSLSFCPLNSCIRDSDTRQRFLCQTLLLYIAKPFCSNSLSLLVYLDLLSGYLVFQRDLQIKMEAKVVYENELNLRETELRLGLPGRDEREDESPSGFRNNKRLLSESSQICGSDGDSVNNEPISNETAPPSKAQIVGWPPIRSYRKNSLLPKKSDAKSEKAGRYVKVSMDGAPYLRKIDLSVYKGYPDLIKALEDMFKFTAGEFSEREGYKGSEHSPTYEDKDGDWMLVGDVPWDMFMSSCRRLRIMKRSVAKGLNYCS